MSDPWFAQNRAEIAGRLRWLTEEPDGVVYHRLSPLHRIVIAKDAGIVRMFFVDPHPAFGTPAVSGPMSALALADPLDLGPTPYNQALLLPLLWQPAPRRVYGIGFAGGRVPLVLHHHLPEVTIESTDIDPDVGPLAQRFFGVGYDRRQRVIVQDGRAYLAAQPATARYDIILVDAFRGTGYSPLHLGTVGFYELCKRHLSAGGVVAVNLVPSDTLLLDKIATLQACFSAVYVQVDRTIVALGTAAPAIAPGDKLDRAAQIQSRHGFAFPFVQRAGDLRPLSECAEYLRPFGRATTILQDAVPLPESIRTLAPDDPIFYNADPSAPCPCGSGRPFARCHGQEAR